MAISQQVVPSKLRHLQSFASSGLFYPPLGTTIVYVAVLGATGGAGYSGRYGGGAGGASVSGGGYVQVSAGNPHTVTVGAGGVTSIVDGGKGTSGGLTSFDGSITAGGGTGGNSGSNSSYQGNAGNAGTAANAATALTSLPALNPGGSTTVKVTGFSAGSAITGSQVNGVVHIYGY